MKEVIVGVLNFIFGFIIVAFLSTIFGSSNSYLTAIVFSIIYLSSIIIICTERIIKSQEKK